MFVAMTPEELYERKVTMEQLYAAIDTLPDKQAKRIYAHFFLGMSKTAIAKAEGVNESAIRKSLDRALRDIEIFLKKRSERGRMAPGNVTAYERGRHSPAPLIGH